MNGRRPDPVPRLAWILASLVALALVAPVIWHATHQFPSRRLVDLEVYREAGFSVRTGRAVYLFATPPPQDLPFTYPPFAALLFVPLTLVSFSAAGWIWSLASLALLIWLVAYCFRPVVAEWQEWLGAKIGDRRRAAVLTAVAAPMLLPLMMWLEPVRTSFRFGQVNLIIAVLVVADCCLPQRRWPRGILVGLATAIKLTPGLFIPYLWLSGRRRAAYVATATFFAAQGVAAAVLPGDSRMFWTDSLFHSGRLGDNTVTANVAIRGALLRLDPPPVVFAVVLVLAVLGFLVIGMSRALLASRGGAELAGVVLVGLTSVAISPVSWDHHLIWLVPAFALLLADPSRARLLMWAVALSALFYSRFAWSAASVLRRIDGVAVIGWRTVNLSFTIAVLVMIVTLPLKSVTQLPRSWLRGGDLEG